MFLALIFGGLGFVALLVGVFMAACLVARDADEAMREAEERARREVRSSALRTGGCSGRGELVSWSTRRRYGEAGCDW
jgi:hypothetical protein